MQMYIFLLTLVYAFWAILFAVSCATYILIKPIIIKYITFFMLLCFNTIN